MHESTKKTRKSTRAVCCCSVVLLSNCAPFSLLRRQPRSSLPQCRTRGLNMARAVSATTDQVDIRRNQMRASHMGRRLIGRGWKQGQRPRGTLSCQTPIRLSAPTDAKKNKHKHRSLSLELGQANTEHEMPISRLTQGLNFAP